MTGTPVDDRHDSVEQLAGVGTGPAGPADARARVRELAERYGADPGRLAEAPR